MKKREEIKVVFKTRTGKRVYFMMKKPKRKGKFKSLREWFESALFTLFLAFSAGLLVFLALQVDKADVFYWSSVKYINIVSPSIILMLASFAFFLTAFIIMLFIKREG